jgi:hypothetical protein
MNKPEPYEGKTAMRAAFEAIPVNPHGKWSDTVKHIHRSLRRGAGTFKASGWRNLNGRKRKQKGRGNP